MNGNEYFGKGWNKLVKEADTIPILFFGENHGIQEIASFANSYYKAITTNEPRILVTEIGPATATITEELVQNNSFEEFLSQKTNLHSIPFFFLEQEVPLLKSAIKKNKEKNYPSVWGLDQEFIAGAPVIIKRLEQLAITEEEKNAIATFRRQAFLNPFLIGMGSGEGVKDLKTAFESSNSVEAQRITEQLILSHQIYIEQMGGDYRWSNERRETLMMENFEWYANQMKDSIPAMFFKFGAFHLHQKQSPTVQEALGARVKKWANAREMKTLGIYIDAMSGQTLDALWGNTTDLPSVSTWKKSVFAKHVENSPVVFDLRPLRKIPERKEWHNRIQLMVLGYDYLVLFPKATPANFLDGTLVTHAYGIVIGSVVLITFSLFVFFIFRWIKRWRRKRAR